MKDLLLLSDKLPYFFLTLIAIVSYQISTVINMETHSPILAFDYHTIEQKTIGDTVVKKLACEIKNLNRDKAFKNITLQIRFRRDGYFNTLNPAQVRDPEIIAVAPSAIVPDTLVNCIDNNINEYSIPIIHPNSKYILNLTTIQNKEINEYPKIYIEATTDVNLVEAGLTTFLIEYQLPINLYILLVLMISIGLYLFFILKNKK